jgi:serine/threonine protein phosphatase 1
MERIFAIGDIHGCFDKLIALMDIIDVDLERDIMVFIGDYIDRGAQSKEVVEYLVDLSGRAGKAVFLKGNHEWMLEQYLNGTNQFGFLANGGLTTLDSYSNGGFTEETNLIPATHLDFLRQLRIYYETDQYIFVHAGLRPDVPLEEQNEWDMLWIREEFIYSDFDFGRRVIFGHTPFQKPVIFDNKIGIDTGAVYGNKLTCVELPAERFYSI